MSAVFLAFANSQENRLPTLSQEDDQVYASLAQRAAQQHITIHRDSFATTSKITSFLILYRDYLNVFLYSGHAGAHQLELEDQDANAAGIAHLLGQCPNLKLIILNGCSTAGQVQRLIALPNHPVVIATSAPVNDFAATQFSIAFFQMLGNQFETIGNAFEAGLGAAKTVHMGEIRAGRKDIAASNPNEPLWGMYYDVAGEGNLQWRLPTTFNISFSNFTPNEHLIQKMLEAFAPYQAEIAQIVDDEKAGNKRSIVDKRELILQNLPHPVSEQLRKLIVPEQAGYNAVFYDKVGADRLRQITLTYSTVIELITSVMLSQLWDTRQGKPDLKITDAQRELIRAFLKLDFMQKQTYNFFPIIRTIREIFDTNKVTYFVEELVDISQAFNEQSDFFHACNNMETLRKQFAQRVQFDQNEAARLCVIAEEKLAIILSKLGFMARYVMTSIKEIDVLKYRHNKNPKYRHKLVKLVARQGGIAEEPEDLLDFLDSASVIMQRKGGTGDKAFLNLSPFVIDANAFNEKATDSQLYFFDRYEQGGDAYAFKHIYKPDDMPLIINRQAEFDIIKEQFDAFAELLFNTPMQAL